MSPAPTTPPSSLPLPAAVVICPARGGGTGHVSMLRELIDRLVGLGVETSVQGELDQAVRAIAERPGALLIIDVDDANHGHALPGAIATRIEGAVRQLPDVAPVAIATRPTAGTILTCYRAGAVAVVDLGQDSFEAAVQLLSRAARDRARALLQRRALDQLHDMVDELVRDLVRTERRSIDLEKQLAELGGGDEVASDLDHGRAPVVMVVEDDRATSDYLVAQLEAVGLTTFAFATGEEATAHADRMSQRGEALDLVVVAMALPGIDGLEVVRRLRKDRPQLAAFLVTAYADPTLSARATDLGVVGLVTKPFGDSRPLVRQIQEEARAAIIRTREQGYLQRIKTRHDKVLGQYRLLLAGLATG